MIPVVIYPNPSTGSFTLEISKELKSNYSEHVVKIIDIFGRLVFAKPLLESQTKIELEGDISSGIYIVEVENNKGGIIAKQKIVIQ